MYLLDICAISEIFKKKPNKEFIHWVELQIDVNLFLSVITIGELEKGISKLTIKQSQQRKKIEAWVRQDLQLRFDRRILPFDLATTTIWGSICGDLEKKGKPVSVIDVMIAATAIQHKLTIITRNDKDFCNISGAKLLNPWS